jgi:hypothetical protein
VIVLNAARAAQIMPTPGPRTAPPGARMLIEVLDLAAARLAPSRNEAAAISIATAEPTGWVVLRLGRDRGSSGYAPVRLEDEYGASGRVHRVSRLARAIATHIPPSTPARGRVTLARARLTPIGLWEATLETAGVRPDRPGMEGHARSFPEMNHPLRHVVPWRLSPCR